MWFIYSFMFLLFFGQPSGKSGPGRTIGKSGSFTASCSYVAALWVAIEFLIFLRIEDRSFSGSGRPRGPGRPFQKVGGEAFPIFSTLFHICPVFLAFSSFFHLFSFFPFFPLFFNLFKVSGPRRSRILFEGASF